VVFKVLLGLAFPLSLSLFFLLLLPDVLHHFLLFLQDLREHELFHVQIIREFNSRVQLLVLKRIEVKDDPLEMDDEHIGEFIHHCFLLHIDPLPTGITTEVTNDLSSNELLQAIIERLLVLDLH